MHGVKKILEKKNKHWHGLWIKEIGVIFPLDILSFPMIMWWPCIAFRIKRKETFNPNDLQSLTQAPPPSKWPYHSQITVANQCLASFLYSLKQKHIAARAQYLTWTRCSQNFWSFPHSHRNLSSNSSKEHSNLLVREAGIWTQIISSISTWKCWQWKG